jgi:uncharacterized phage protein (TIGR02216 family)
MKRVAWPKLMRLGLVQMGLDPDIFWNLTPAELMLMASGGGDEALSRAGLAELAERFPDKSRAEPAELE